MKTMMLGAICLAALAVGSVTLHAQPYQNQPMYTGPAVLLAADDHAERLLPGNPASRALELSVWQEGLLRPNVQKADWSALMAARSQIHHLEDMCEEQADAMQRWLDTAQEQPAPALSQAERDALVARADGKLYEAKQAGRNRVAA